MASSRTAPHLAAADPEALVAAVLEGESRRHADQASATAEEPISPSMLAHATVYEFLARGLFNALDEPVARLAVNVEAEDA